MNLRIATAACLFALTLGACANGPPAAPAPTTDEALFEGLRNAEGRSGQQAYVEANATKFIDLVEANRGVFETSLNPRDRVRAGATAATALVSLNMAAGSPQVSGWIEGQGTSVVDLAERFAAEAAELCGTSAEAAREVRACVQARLMTDAVPLEPGIAALTAAEAQPPETFTAETWQALGAHAEAFAEITRTRWLASTAGLAAATDEAAERSSYYRAPLCQFTNASTNLQDKAAETREAFQTHFWPAARAAMATGAPVAGITPDPAALDFCETQTDQSLESCLVQTRSSLVIEACTMAASEALRAPGTD